MRGGISVCVVWTECVRSWMEADDSNQSVIPKYAADGS